MQRTEYACSARLALCKEYRRGRIDPRQLHHDDESVLGTEDYVDCFDKLRASSRHVRGALDGGRSGISQQDGVWRKR